MPKSVDKIREAVQRENPGMAKSRTYAIATSAFKRKVGLPQSHVTEKEMAEKAKTAGPVLQYGIEKMKETIKRKKKTSIIRDKLAAQSSVSFPEVLKGLKTTKTLKTSEKEDTDPSTESSGVKADEEMETLPKQSALRKMAKEAASGMVRITSTPKGMATGGEIRSVEMPSKDFGEMSSAYADALRQNYPAMPKAQIHDAALATARDAVRRVAFREKPSYKFGQDIPPDLGIGGGKGKKSSGWWKPLVGALGGAGLGAGAGYAAHKAGLSPKAILAGTAAGGAGGLMGGEYWKAKTAAAKWESQPTFAARHPNWTAAGGALLGGYTGALPGRIALTAGADPKISVPIALGGGVAGMLGGGYMGYRHAKKRQQQFLKGSPEGKTIMRKQADIDTSKLLRYGALPAIGGLTGAGVGYLETRKGGSKRKKLLATLGGGAAGAALGAGVGAAVPHIKGHKTMDKVLYNMQQRYRGLPTVPLHKTGSTQLAFQGAFFDELSKIAQGVSVGQYIKGGLQKAVKAIPKPKLPTSIPKPKLPGISGGLKPISL